MSKITFFICILIGVLILPTTILAAESKFAGGTYSWDWGQIEQINLVKEGQGYSVEIWPYKDSRPTGELGKAPLKYFGGPEVIEIATLIASRPSIIRGVTYATSKVVAQWGTPSYISGGKKIPMYRITSFFFHPTNLKPGEKKKSGEMMKSGKLIEGSQRIPDDPQGWCCVDGKVFRALGHECEERRGIIFSPDRNEVLQHCKEIFPESSRLTPYRGEPRSEGNQGDATPITLP